LGCDILSTFKQIVERIRSDLSDRTPVTFPDEELFRYVIEGADLVYKYVAQAAPSYLAVKTTVAIVEDDYELAFPTGGLFIDSVWIMNSDDIFYPTVRVNKKTVMGNINTTGIPYTWSLYKDTLLFSPKADDSYTAVIYYVPAYTAPTTYTTDIGVGSEFDMLVTEYAIIRAHNRNMRQPIIEQQFFNIKSETIRQLLNKYGDEKISMEKTMFTNNYYPVDW